MRKILMILLTYIISSGIIFGQQPDEKKTQEHKVSIGFSLGPSFSKYIPGSSSTLYGLPGTITYDITYEKEFRIGFNAGAFAEMQFAKHFSTRFEFNYLYSSKHDVKYVENGGGAFAYTTYGDYSFTSSTKQFAILPKIYFGQQNKIYLLIGPYFDLAANAHHFTGTTETIEHYYPGHPATDSVTTYNILNGN